MKGRNPKGGEGRNGEMEGPKSTNTKKRKRNMMRMGGTGLSLEAFANAKSTRSHYNPALIKKQREFYKNAKHVSKFKKKLRQPSQQNDLSSAVRPLEEAKNIIGEDSKMIRKNNKKSGSHSLQELYQKQREEAEKIRMEREAAIKAKKEEREKAEARRKAERHELLRKTQRGQPLMKYRMKHLLQAIQGSR